MSNINVLFFFVPFAKAYSVIFIYFPRFEANVHSESVDRK